MKQTDIDQAVRILRIVNQLTAEECSSVEIHNDNPDFNGMPDCCVTVHRLGAGLEMVDEDFRGDSVFDCLLKALAKRGLKVEDPSGDNAQVADAATRAVEMFERCRKASGGRFSGSSTTSFKTADGEFELTIKPARTGFAFVEKERTPEQQAEYDRQQLDYFLDPDGDDGS